MTFTDKNSKLDYVWATSWGVTTRLIGALIMTHSDDLGLVLPPELAPIHVVIVPIYKTESQRSQIAAKAEQIKKMLEDKGLSVKFDNRETHKPGWKFAEYELKGVPVRLAVGPRDYENDTVELARRDTLEKETVPLKGIDERIGSLLPDIQDSIYKKALRFRDANTFEVDSYEEMKERWHSVL